MLRYLFVYSTYNKISSLFPNYNVNPFHFQIRSSSDMSIFTHCRRLSYINLRYLNKNGSDSVRPLLELNNISYSYHTIDGETKALSDISFQLAPGEFAAVVGPSGCGKSTLLSLIAGLIEAENGTIFLDGEPSEKSFRKSAKIGYMLQHDHLFEWRSILKNVLLGAEINKSVSQETKQRAKELLRQYGLKRFINSRPSELSGGMRQRAALIRTLMPNPELLLLDEPFSALDYQTRLTVSDDIGKIIKHSGKTALLVTHDLSEAISLADRMHPLPQQSELFSAVHCDYRLSFISWPYCITPPEKSNAQVFRCKICGCMV